MFEEKGNQINSLCFKHQEDFILLKFFKNIEIFEDSSNLYLKKIKFYLKNFEQSLIKCSFTYKLFHIFTFCSCNVLNTLRAHFAI